MILGCNYRCSKYRQYPGLYNTNFEQIMARWCYIKSCSGIDISCVLSSSRVSLVFFSPNGKTQWNFWAKITEYFQVICCLQEELPQFGLGVLTNFELGVLGHFGSTKNHTSKIDKIHKDFWIILDF